MTRARNELAVFTFPPEKTSSAFSQFLFRPKRRIPRKSKKKDCGRQLSPRHAGAAQRLWRGRILAREGDRVRIRFSSGSERVFFRWPPPFRTGFSACGRNPAEMPQKPIDTVGNSLYHNLNGPCAVNPQCGGHLTMLNSFSPNRTAARPPGHGGPEARARGGLRHWRRRRLCLRGPCPQRRRAPLTSLTTTRSA